MYKEAKLSKQTTDKNYLNVKKMNDQNATMTRQQRQELANYQIDESKLAQEEEFFNKWLKQILTK